VDGAACKRLAVGKKDHCGRSLPLQAILTDKCRSAGGRVTDDYHLNGFTIARGFFDAAGLRRITAEVERVVDAAAASAEHGRVYFDSESAAAQRSESAVRCVFRIEDHSPFLAELLHSAALMQLVQPLLGEAPVADSIQYIDKPPFATYQFPAHQDNAYQFFRPALALVATVGLDAQDAASGAIAFLRGSHQLEVLPHAPSGVLGASRGLVGPPDTERFPEATPELAAGDVLIHHTNVIHRTGPNQTGSHRRNLGFGYHGVSATVDADAVANYQRLLAAHQGVA
jgi:ectoine hydroxylase-related dioxygenase (phytanoyl-CoA dioxygenase family)